MISDAMRATRVHTLLAPSLAGALLLASSAMAQEPPPAPPAPVEAAQAPEAPALPEDAPAAVSPNQAEIEALEARVAELRSAEAEAQAVRDELRELREELRELRNTRKRSRTRWEDNDRVGFGSVVRVEVGQEVDEVVGFGDDVEVYGTVNGDATAFGGSVVIGPSGVVRGDAVAFGGDVTVERGGRIEGGRVSLGVPGVSVQEAPEQTAMGSLGAIAGDAQSLLSMLYRRLVLLLSFAGAGVLVVGLFPGRVGRIATTLEERPFRSAFVGLMATGFLSLFSLIFAVITLGLGLPVSMMVVALLGLAWLMGFIGLCQAVGDRLPFESKPHGRWLAFLVGTVLMISVGSLPLVGWLVVLAASTIGIGASLSSRFGGR